MKRIKIYLLVAGISLCYSSFAQSFNRPESIVYDTIHNRYLISNYGDGSNGSILAYDPFENTYSNFNTSHSVGPKGLAIHQNTLYVSESGFINGFNLNTGQRVFNKEFGSFWINDLTVDQDGNLYTGETNTGIIYKINTSNGHVEEWIDGGLDNLNGLLVDDERNRLLVVFYKPNSPVLEIDLDTKEIITLTETSYSNFDGITVDNCGNYYISSQGSSVVLRYDHEFSTPPVLVAENLTTPADIFFNQDLDVLCIPEIDNNQIVYIDIFRICQQPDLLLPENGMEGVQPGQIDFSWEPISGVDYYRIEIAKGENFQQVIIVDGTGTEEYQTESLEPSTNYFWRVNAYKQNQSTEYSEIWSFTTASSSSVNSGIVEDEFLLYPNPCTGSINLSWGEEVPELMQVYNSSGCKLIQIESFQGTKYSEQIINLDVLKPGFYTCVLRYGSEKLWQQKIVIH